jgi:hypothetical protein
MFSNRYAEAIPYLYSANTFVVSESRVMEYLPRLLLPQRIDTILSVTFYFHIPLNPRQVLDQASQETDSRLIGLPGTWNAIWENISAMKSLHTLHVKLHVLAIYWENLNQDFSTRLLQPIKKVVIPKEFVLSLPFSAMDGSPPRIKYAWNTVDGWQGRDPWEELPCIVRRVSSNRDL